MRTTTCRSSAIRHPRVVEAIARQAAILNTNTRYLHETVVELAERLVATMPPGLDTVMFVNSGTEANDLAWRLATTVTGGSGGIVTDFAYHGVSTAIAALSPEAWPRGDRPEWVETFAPPDLARGAAADSRDLEAAIDRLIGRGTPTGRRLSRRGLHERRRLRAARRRTCAGSSRRQRALAPCGSATRSRAATAGPAMDRGASRRLGSSRTS